MKEARLRFCQEHKDWTLEDWKNVIWTDETLVCLSHRRGGVRVWRTKADKYDPTVVRPRWHGASEFMFWGCFSYDKKGPCHIWKPETAQERKAAQKQIDKLNKELEPALKAEWELNQRMERLRITQNVPGPKPQWKMNAENGALVRTKGKGGIDWWRYQQVILKPKLIPFALECMKDHPHTIVQEDKAPSHASKYQHSVFSFHKIARLFWPGNSPDLNMIEPCWPHMKRRTTRKGPPTNRKDAEKVWRQCWAELEQGRIQRWIERIVRHVRQVNDLYGDNNYREGSTEESVDSRKARWQARARRNYS
jgi:transposase